MGDDELLDALGEALSEPVDGPLGDADEARVERIRATAAARRDAGDGGPVVDDERRAFRPSWWYVAAAAVLAVVLTAAVALAITGGDDGSDGVVEYAGPITGEAGSGEVVVTKTGIGRVIELDTSDLPILPTGELYQVWFVGPGDRPGAPNRISAGTFHPDDAGRSDVTFAAAVDPALYPRLEITAEPGDGDPAASDVVVLEVDLG